MTDFFLSIISTKRSQNVQFIQSLCKGLNCNWFVNTGEGSDYINAGAHATYESGDNICAARNMAISLAGADNMPCIQISDDLKSVKKLTVDSSGKRHLEFIDIAYVCVLLISELKKHNANFGGVAINNNPLNYTGIDVSTNKLIVNDFICVMPGTYIFDEELALKEDYDMCVRQLIDGNKIIRLNNILCDFPHRQNDGGANTYRNESTESAATRALMAKWPKYIVPHKTRPGQVSLDYRAIEKRIKGIEPENLFGI